MVPKNALRVLFVWPHGNDCTSTLPLGIAYLKSNVKDKNMVLELCDLSFSSKQSFRDHLTDKLRSFKPDCVLISSWSHTIENALEINRLIKRHDRNIVTLLGGLGVTAMNTERVEDILRNNEIDHLVRGEAELSIESVLSQLNGKNKSTNDKRSYTDCIASRNLDLINPPDFDFININRYIKIGYSYSTAWGITNLPIITTRGCPYKCKFCAAPKIVGHALRKHSISYIKEEISRLYKTYSPGRINIIDDAFASDINHAKEVCNVILSLGLKGVTFGTANGVRIENLDRELLKLMKACGWEHIIIAPESGSKKILKSISKGINPEEVAPIVRMIKQEGLLVHGLFIIGFPEETHETIKETERMILNTDFDTVAVFRFQPAPGTALFEELVQKKEIPKDFVLSDWKSNSDFKYTPPNFTNSELKNIRKKIAMKFYMRPSKMLAVVKYLHIRHVLRALVNYVMP